MSFYQSDQVVRRGHARGDNLAEPLMTSTVTRPEADGATVVNPLLANATTAPYTATAAYNFQAAPPSQAKTGCFKCKLVTVLVVLLGMSWSTYSFLYGARDDLEPNHESWVTVNGTEFWADCRPYVFAGFNTDNMKDAMVVMTQWSNYIGRTEGQMLIRKTMQEAAAAGLTVIRTWAHTTNPDYPLQESPGKYNEKALFALDTVIDEARRAGLRVIPTFVDNWKYYGGVDEFVDWSPTVTPRKKEYPPVNIQGDNTPADFDEERKDYETARHALFYTDENCKSMYKTHVKTILERRNAVNGRLYLEDPTILGWSLINEPRCETWKVANCVSYLQKWLEEMAAYVKSIDSRHLLTIGEEGFFAANSPRVAANPADWAPLMGQNFSGNHMIPEIDFATVHVWPDNWNNYTYEFFSEWINAHVEDTMHLLRKPMVMTEFGRKLYTKDRKREIVETRDPVFNMAYRIFHENLERNTVLRGILFWKLGVQVYERSGPGEYGVVMSDTTWPIIKENAVKIHARVASTLPDASCALDCWVAGEPKYGTFNVCENRPSVCRALAGDVPSEDGPKVFTSELACCTPVVGAFPKGCAWLTTKPPPALAAEDAPAV